MAGGSIGRSKFNAAIVGLRFYPCLGVGLLVRCLPVSPWFVAFCAVFPIIVCWREALAC